MNELLFFTHIALILGFTLFSLRMGVFALTCLIAIEAIFANLFVVKEMHLFGFAATCSDVFAVGSLLGLNLLQEYFGKQAAKRAVILSFGALVFFFAMSQMHLFYLPTDQDKTHFAFSAIFSSTFRLVAASIAVYYIVQKLDIGLYGWFKRKFPDQPLFFRLFASLLLTQFLDTVLFSYLALYGIVESVWDIIAISYLVKCAVIFTSSTVSFLTKKWIPSQNGAQV